MSNTVGGGEVGEGSTSKKGSPAWKYFTQLANERAQCNICNTTCDNSGGLTKNILSHLVENHIENEEHNEGIEQPLTIDENNEREGSTSKKRSPAWMYFTQLANKRAQCNICKITYGNSGGSTKSLLRHLVEKHIKNKEHNEGRAQPIATDENNWREGMNQIPTMVFQEDGFDSIPDNVWEETTKEAILANLPLEPPHIQKAWNFTGKVGNIEEEIRAYHQREKEKLVAQLEKLTSQVSFSIETIKETGWTISKKETGWISIAAHFIDDNFKLIKKLIGFKKLHDLSSESCKADITQSCISEWKLENKIFSFTIEKDDELFGNLVEKYGKFILPCFKKETVEFYFQWQGKFFLDNDPIMEIVRKVASPGGWFLYNKIARADNWIFCCSVLELFKEALQHYSKEVLREGSLTETSQASSPHPDYNRWKELHEVINCFEEMSPIIDQLSKYPTSNLYFQSYNVLYDRLENVYNFCDVISDIMIFCVAFVLDPRHKLTFFEYLVQNEIYKSLPDFQKVPIEVRKSFDTLFDKYAKVETNQASPLSTGTANIQEGCSSSSFTNQGLSRINKGYLLYRKESMTTKKEVNEYLREEEVDVENTNFDLLEWWKENRSRYPVLSNMARDLLAVPACTYSVQEYLKSDLRNLDKVSPELVEAVICSKDWILSDV